MNRKYNYYVDSDSKCVVVSVLLLVGSIIIRLVTEQGSFSTRGEFLWLSMLPLISEIVLIIDIIAYGESNFYRTAIPVSMLCLYYAVRPVYSGYSTKMTIIMWAVCLVIAFIYGITVSGKRKKGLIESILIVLFCAIVINIKRSEAPTFFAKTVGYLPDLLTVLSVIFVVFAMEKYLDEGFHPTWGDRPDGRRVRSISPISAVGPFIMPTKQGSTNRYRDRIETTEIDRYIAEKRKEGYKGFGFQHVFMTAFLRCLVRYPQANRFLSGQKIYQRGNDIQFCMVVKTSLTVDGEESIVKLHFNKDDNVISVYEKLNAEIERIKNKGIGGSNFDKAAGLFSLIPGVALRFSFRTIAFIDYFGLLPQKIIELSPFHASTFFTSMGSLGIQPVDHHLYDFGNLPIFCSFGKKYSENELQNDGSVAEKKYIDFIFTMDERICDGYYYAQMLKYLKRLMADPSKLDLPPEKIGYDIP